ncbi:TPA: acylneuraminate cytidylyltransferase [Candidatus Woesearchaeota archaeon]|nr:acylneuraminate cytidylyltransferase [Candidatus Woesearchaeota archaeon]HII68549.1 acylneuraminate cytidylyltransferase [Candidatus Woesearchaeota archaeon]
MANNVVCIIQARTGSSRLPNKVLKKVEGKELLLHTVDRVLQSKFIDKVIVATTTLGGDDAVVSLLSGYNPDVSVFRGSEDDVLDRYYLAAIHAKADIVVRITSDCPLIDHGIIDRVITVFLKGKHDYVSNTLTRRTFPRGLDVEVISFSALEKVWNIAKLPEEREHVTWYIRRHPKEFNTFCIEQDPDRSSLRWTVDEEDDLKFIKEVYAYLYPSNADFTSDDVLNLIQRHPWIANINAHVEQKMVGGKRQ